MRLLVLFALFGFSATAHAQEPGSGPSSADGARVVVGGELTATVAPTDPGFFNYTDYEYNALRNVRLALAAAVRANDHLQVLGEIRLDQAEVLRPYALYLRVRPWPTRPCDIQIGRVPATFGAFSRQAYGTGNLLIGSPLAYQYLTSLRPDAAPAIADDLLRMRGRGWLTSFPLGNPAAGPGVPLVNLSRQDTGIQMHAAAGPWRITTAVTAGTLSNPRVDDDNGGRHVAARATVQASPGLLIGASASSGAFLARTLEPVLPAHRSLNSYRQQALGLDAEYSRDRWLVRGEIIGSRWALPSTTTLPLPLWLTATTWWLEGRYRVSPGIDLAARGERLTFSTIEGSTRAQSWDAPVSRVEVGASWTLHRQVIVKGSLQRNVRDGGRVRRDTLGAAQLLVWF